MLRLQLHHMGEAIEAPGVMALISSCREISRTLSKYVKHGLDRLRGFQPTGP